MDILFDTNIFIHREDDEIVPEPLRKLEKLLKEQGHIIYIHPLSEEELLADPNKARRKKNESRVETYPTLGFPSYPSGKEFREKIPEGNSNNEVVDNALLFAVHDGLVDFLITEDRGIHKKAIRLGLEERVFTIEEGYEYFEPDQPQFYGSRAIERTTIGELNIQDPIFDSLKQDYEEFEDWAERKADRRAWVNRNPDGSIGAILFLKPNEVEQIGEEPPLPRKRRMKISTLKVAEDRWGSKIGELLISIAVREAVQEELDELYLTYYDNENSGDYFLELISSYGFRREAETEDGEGIYVKRLVPGPGENPSPIEATKQYYPSFYDGEEVDKFLVPIQPEYHNKLFPSYSKRQTALREFEGRFYSEGNAIKKAYLNSAKNYQVGEGDILLFYRSRDEKEVTSLGVCESAHYNITDTDQVRRIVGKRSVFSDAEIEERAESGTNILLFRWHFDLADFLPYKKLLEADVLTSPLQVMRRIPEESYEYIKEKGGIDERFTLD